MYFSMVRQEIPDPPPPFARSRFFYTCNPWTWGRIRSTVQVRHLPSKEMLDGILADLDGPVAGLLPGCREQIESMARDWPRLTGENLGERNQFFQVR